MEIVIVGANHAGISAAMTILGHYTGHNVTMFEMDDNVSFVGADALLRLAGKIDSESSMWYSSPEKLQSKGVKLHMQTEVTAVDLKAKTVTGTAKSCESVVKHYDKLILATGSSARKLGVTGADAENVLTLKTAHDAKKLFKYADSPATRAIAIVGTGHIGVELAIALSIQKQKSADKFENRKIMLFGRSARSLKEHVDDIFATKIDDLLTENGVELHYGENLVAFQDDGKTLVTDSGKYAVDVTVISAGFVANSELLAGEIQRLEGSNVYIVNSAQQTSNADVYAVGDVASSYMNVTGENASIQLGSYATRSGIIAGHNAVTDNKYAKSIGTQGSSSINAYGFIVSTTGLTFGAAQATFSKRNIEVSKTDFTALVKPKYLVGDENAEVTVRLVFETESKRLLGACIASTYDISSALHMLSLAINQNMTLYDLRYVDMFFSPWQNQVYNFVLRAAARGAEGK
ncbi:MAG: FAD-dependent oxidoreductase [Bifidobacteriaceae bacterium]|jgi:NADPH-dependent 2,4-dienoyl-CoA reductase/sulfur reductase-like enzyme|nr:FAD-dependent oxidoreductase [Bifidobacteriaceae bacterium]